MVRLGACTISVAEAETGVLIYASLAERRVEIRDGLIYVPQTDAA